MIVNYIVSYICFNRSRPKLSKVEVSSKLGIFRAANCSSRLNQNHMQLFVGEITVSFVDQNGSILMLTTVACSLILWSSGIVWLYSYLYPLLVPKTREIHPELLQGVMHGLW